MKKRCIGLIGMILVLGSCQDIDQPKEDQPRTISKEHAALLGEWQEDDSLSTQWKFELDEVKWKGFTHFYRLEGDTLKISGLNFFIKNRTDKELRLVNLNGKLCTLIRKE